MNLDLPDTNTLDWGVKINTAITNLYNLIQAKADNNHFHADVPQHSHIEFDEIVETQQAVSAIEQQINNIQTQLTGLNNFFELLNNNLEGLSFTTQRINVINGLRIRMFTSQPLLVRLWEIKIKHNDGIIWEIETADNNVFVSHSEITNGVGFTAQNFTANLQIDVTLKVMTSSISQTYSHAYAPIASDFENMIHQHENILNNVLTIPNIVNNLVTHPEAINAFADKVQHSRTLAQNVAENLKETQ